MLKTCTNTHALALLWLGAGCVPLDDLSSYRSANPEDAPAPSPPDGAGRAADAGAPSSAEPAAGDAGLEPAATLDAGPLPAPSPEPDTRPATPTASPPADAGAVAPPGVLDDPRRETLQVAGRERSFLYHAPDDLDPSVPAPVLIVAHDVGQTAADMAMITGYDAIADREGFVVLYPEGQGSAPWNAGSEVCPSDSSTAAGAMGSLASAGDDDAAFLDAMLAFVADDRRVDSAHVFVSGFGAGAALAHELACRRSDIRAIAAHSGGARALEGCAAAPRPVLVLHGTRDDVMPPACGVEARQRWVEHNGCAGDADTFEVRGGLCDVARGCPVDGVVALCAFVGMGNGWAGSAAQGEAFLDFASASELSWRFFERYAW